VYLRPVGDDAAKAALAVNGTVLFFMVALPLGLILWDDRKYNRRRRK
jgi:uncharacterized membrane protein YhfC